MFAKFKTKHLIVFNLILLTYYTFVVFNLEIGVSYDIMFSSSDSQTYLSVGKWIGSWEATIWTEDRPILYPLLIFISSKISLVYCLWIIQLLFWILTVNLLFIIIFELTKKLSFALLGVLVFISNISIIALTLHALTEVTTIFILAMMLAYIVKNIKKRKQLSFIHRCIAFLGFLVILKPVFSIPLIIILFIIMPFYYLKKYLVSPKKIFLLLLVLSPVFIQLTIMKINHDKIAISLISSKTIDKYFIAQGIQKIESVSRKQSIEKSLAMNSSQKIELVKNNKNLFFQSFMENLHENIKASPTFLKFPKEYINKKLVIFMIGINTLYYYIHLAFLIPILYLIFKLLKTKNYQCLVLILIMSGLSYYYIFVTGISFSQGDRLVLPSIILWLPLYLFSLSTLINKKRMKV